MSSKTNTTATKEEAKPALVPKLRFPGFRKLKGWSQTTLNVIADPVTERAVQGGEDHILSLSAEHGIVLQSEFFGKKVAGENSERYLKIVRNDFVYNDRTTKASTFGTIKRLSKHSGGIVSPIYKCFRFQADENPVFWEQYFQSGNHDAALRGLVNEGARAGRFNISISQFLTTAAFRPTEAEQQKIAECLSSVDELMAAQARKVEALKTHKKGLMQQLFPREGETQPRLRFPEFQNAGAWVPDTLENLCSAKISYGIVQAGPHVPDGMPYIKSTDLNSELCLTNLARTSEAIAQKYRRSEVVPGDIVFSLRGNIGVAQIVPKSIPVANLTQGTARIRTKGRPEFYFHVLRSPSVHNRILAVGKGSTFQEISLEALRNIRLFHPKPPEQQRIADCLSSLDALIIAETQKLEALKTQKKGLMQQLFPSPVEAEA